MKTIEQPSNVILLLALVAGIHPLGAQTVLLFESFEAAFPEYHGWNVGDANASGSYAYWDDVDLNFGGEGAHTGNWKGYCAGFGYGGSSSAPTYQNEMRAFMERSIDLTGYTSATLRFWHKLPSMESCCDLASVYVGTNRVWSDSNPNSAWTETALDLSVHVGGPRTVRFEFASDGSVTAEGWYLDDIQVTGFTPPVNDQCSGANVLVSGVAWTMDTTGASSTGDPVPSCQGNFGKGVWFKHIAPASGALAISTCGSGFDTVLQVFEGSCGRLQPVPNGCADDHGPVCSGSQASIIIPARAGASYSILVGGYGGASGSLTLVARDAEPPDLTCPAILVTNTLRTTCDRAVAYPITVVDNQDPNPLVVCFPPSGTVFPLGTNTVHCMATDAAGNSSSCDFLVVVEDRVAPQITCPSNLIVQTDTYRCEAANIHYSAVFTDNCGLQRSGFDPLPPVTLPKGVWPITAYAVDDAGNSNFCVFTVTVVDREAPIPQLLGDRTVECGTPWEFTTPTATDNCDGTDVIVTVVSTVTNVVGCQQIIFRTWRIADSSSNAVQISQKVTVQDTTPPVIVCASNRVVEWGMPWTFDTPMVTDNCGTNVLLRVVGGSTNAGCGGTFTATRTWEARDACGNTASCQQLVAVMQPELRHTQLAGALVRLDWPEGTLQYGFSATGPFTDVAGATSPYVFTAPQPGGQFYRTRGPDSSNIVGVIVKEIPPGYSLIAHPLLASNNTVAALLQGMPDGVSVFSYPFSGGANNKLAGWNHPGMTLTPGTGVVIHNPYPTNVVARWVGNVFTGNAAVPLHAYDTALVSSVVPQAGLLNADLGWPAFEGDVIYTHDPSGGWRVHAYSAGTWSGGEPVLGLGEAFRYRNHRSVDWTWGRMSPFVPWPCGLSTNDWTPFGAYQGFGMSTGTVNFFTFHPQPGMGRVLDADGVTPVSAAFSAQLYAGHAGTPENSLQAVGTPQPFLGGAASGYIRSANVIVPHVAGGLPCSLQLRVWENAGGHCYECAAVNGAKVGKSMVFQVTLGSDWAPAFPPNANEFFSFRVKAVEPLCTDFTVLPAGSILSGSGGGGYVGGNGVLHLTDEVSYQQGTFLWAAGRPLGSFRAAFKALVGDPSSALPADGFSFCFGSDLNPPFSEEGSGTGLVVSFDTFANAGQEAPAIRLKWNGTTFAQASKRIVTGPPAAFVDVAIELTTNGTVTVSHGGGTVFNAVTIPGFFTLSGDAWFGLGARTGSLNAKHWIDDLCINDDGSFARPRLSVVRSNATVTVSWPHPAPGWRLHASTNLVASGTNSWTEIPPPYATNGPTLQFAEPLPAGNKFFRLHRP